MPSPEKKALSRLSLKRLPYSFLQKVAWSDLDAFAHVNHTRFAIYFENARTQFFSDKHAWNTDQIQSTGPVVHELTLQYRKQVRFPATLDVTIGIANLGSRKFEMACTMWHENDCVCTGYGEFLWIHFEEGRPVRLPPELVAALEPFSVEF
ncbi:MAG: acyl-CoA thioesterase [Leptospiraceae bacterium]|nr:acyl-CoA thioesterase [Leptospiraceae bacterium]